MCGERPAGVGVDDDDNGSSPRVWGTLVYEVLLNFNQRFIPACVGNAFKAPLIIADCAVHPRVCGERFGFSQLPIIAIGSSPRVWGTLPPGVALLAAFRFIPACVGNAECGH